MDDRHYIYIPVVQPSGIAPYNPRSEAINIPQLIEVYSQFHPFKDEESRKLDEKALNKDWDQIAAPLRKAGLYYAGCVAARAVQKLGLKRPRAALYQFFRSHAWIEGQRLHSSSPQGPTEGHSAELGLALALLLGASDTHRQSVIATGALSHNPSSREHDWEVLPVGSLPEKLRLVIQHVKEKGLPNVAKRNVLAFFTPRHFEQNGTLTAVENLKEVQELSRLGVNVVPISWLSEAAQVLHAHNTRYLFYDRLIQLLFGGFAAFVLLGASWSWWRYQTIPMDYIPTDPRTLAAEPFVVCATKEGNRPLPVRQQGLVHVIAINSTLGWKVKIGDPNSWHAKLGSLLNYQGYYVAQVMISEFSKPKIIVPRLEGTNQPLRILPGGVWQWGWKLNQNMENNGLVLLAQRHTPFNPLDLQKRLLQRFPQAAANAARDQLNVTAAVNFMHRQAPGAIDFIFQTVEAEPRCTETYE